MVATSPRASTQAEDKTEAKKPAPQVEIPEPKLESECGADYIPLLTALKCGQFEEADQMTRDLLIEIGGESTQKRGFVYFSEAKRLPMKDMQTIDKLWSTYSDGKFGFSMQKRIWNSPQVKGDFNLFVQQINWTQGPCGGCESVCSGCTGTLKRWLPIGSKGNEFIYDAKKAPKGHLPLTSALRGTYLLKSLLEHPALGAEPVMGRPQTEAAVKATDPRDLQGQVTEPLQRMEALRFGESPYAARKQPWDV